MHKIWSIFDTVVFASGKCPGPQDTFDHMDNLSVLAIFICEKTSEAFAEITDNLLKVTSNCLRF